jgi:hypothetical protein
MYAQGVDLLDGFLARNAQAPEELRVALALHLDAAGDIARAETALAQCSQASEAADEARAYVALRSQDPKAALDPAKQALDADDASAANPTTMDRCCTQGARRSAGAIQERAADRRQTAGSLYNMAIVEAFYFDEAAGREWFTRYKRSRATTPTTSRCFGPRLRRRERAQAAVVDHDWRLHRSSTASRAIP